MIISDTIYYRADGTVSSIARVTRESFTKPSGAEAHEDVAAEVTLDAVKQHLGEAYAGMDSHNKTLEAQIVTERNAAAAEKAQIMADAQAALSIVTQERDDARAAATKATSALDTVRQADASWNAIVTPLLTPQ